MFRFAPSASSFCPEKYLFQFGGFGIFCFWDGEPIIKWVYKIRIWMKCWCHRLNGWRGKAGKVSQFAFKLGQYPALELNF